jgi:putative peptidoglycan lipid II flippase
MRDDSAADSGANLRKRRERASPRTEATSVPRRRSDTDDAHNKTNSVSPGRSRVPRRSLSVGGSRNALVGVFSFAILAVPGLALGLGRWLAQSAALGATEFGEAYAVAFLAPAVLFGLAGGGALLPVARQLGTDPAPDRAAARTRRAGARIGRVEGRIGRIPAGGERNPAEGGHPSDSSDRITSSLLTWSLFAFVPLGAALAALARPVASILLPGGSPGQVLLAASLLRIFALHVPLYGIGAVLVAVLRTHGRRAWLVIAPATFVLIATTTYLLFCAQVDDRPVSSWVGAAPANDAMEIGDAVASSAILIDGASSAFLILAWGTTLAVASSVLVLFIPVVRLGVLRPTLRFPPGVGRQALHLLTTHWVGLMVAQLAIIVVIVLANAKGAPGTLNVLQYSVAVQVLTYAFLIIPLFRKISLPSRDARGERGEMPESTRGAAPQRARLNREAGGAASPSSNSVTAGSSQQARPARNAGVRIRVLAATATITAGLLIASARAVEALFAAVDVGDVTGMAGAVTWLAPGLVAFALAAHLSRILFWVGRSRAVVSATAIGAVIVIATSVVLVTIVPTGESPATLRGLALSMSIGLFATAALLLHAAQIGLGPNVVVGLNQTLTVAAGSATFSAIAGRLLTERILAGSPGVGIVLVAGLAGCIVVLGISLAALRVGDPFVSHTLGCSNWR